MDPENSQSPDTSPDNPHKHDEENISIETHYTAHTKSTNRRESSDSNPSTDQDPTLSPDEEKQKRKTAKDEKRERRARALKLRTRNYFNTKGYTVERLHRETNETAMRALGGRPKYAWLSGGAVKRKDDRGLGSENRPIAVDAEVQEVKMDESEEEKGEEVRADGGEEDATDESNQRIRISYAGAETMVQARDA